MNERFKELRKALQMNMEQFGKILGISKSGVSEIESGRRNVTEQHIRLLTAKPIDGKTVSETWLRTGEGEMFVQQAEPDAALADALGKIITAGPDDFKRRLISILVQIPESHWAVLADIASKLADDPQYKAAPAPLTPETEKGIRNKLEEIAINSRQQNAVEKSC